MSLHHKLLTLTNIILQFIRKFFVKLGIVSPNRLRVLIYHDIHQNEEHVLETQLNWLKKNWNIISPSNFTAMISGKKPIKGDNLLITFSTASGATNISGPPDALGVVGNSLSYTAVNTFSYVKKVGDEIHNVYFLHARSCPHFHLISSSKFRPMQE